MTTPTTTDAGPDPSEPDTNPLAFPDGVVTRNTGQGNTGGMIALVPSADDVNNLAVDGGEDPDELHLTLAYLGPDMSELTPEQMAALHQSAADLAESIRDGNGPQPQGQVFGHAHFNPTGDDPCAVYLVDGDGLPDLNEAASKIGSDVLGEQMHPQHPVFTPHVTGKYGATPASLSYTGPVNFDRLRLALGDNQTDYPLQEPEPDMPDATTAAAEAPQVDLSEVSGEPCSFPVVIVEGLETSDHRYIAPGALSHRALPLPILAQTVNSGDGHKGAEVVGKITQLTRVPGPSVVDKETGQPFPEGTFIWQGEGEIDPESSGGKAAMKGYLTGNSADLSDMDAEYEYADPEGMEELARQAEAGSEEAKVAFMDAPQRLVVSGGKIAATTLVPIPAFAQAYITIGGQEMAPTGDASVPVPDDLASLSEDEFRRVFDANPPGDNPEAAGRLLSEGLRRAFGEPVELVTASAWRSAEVGDECLLCELAASADEWDEDGYELAAAPNAAKRADALKKGLAMPPAKGQPAGAARYPVTNAADLAKAIRAVGRGTDGDHNAIRKHIMAAAKKLGLADQIPDNWGADGSLKNVAASGFSDHVLPAYYFADPQLTKPTALAVDDDGHVYGHLATWGTCHIGFAGQCVQPPRSGSDYAYFATGAVRVRDTDEGALHTQAVGHITLGTGHANMQLGAKPAAEHYDNTGSVVADVAAGEDAYGIWVAGKVRDDADAALLRASALSGDWRKIGGRLELVAALGVNVPGFPIPRARVASGEQTTLVAAGAVMPQPETVTQSRGELADEIGKQVLEYLQANLKLGGDEEKTGGDSGTNDGNLARDAALIELGLDERDNALREIALGELEAAPFV